VNQPIPGNTHDAESGRQVARHRADPADNAKEAARMDRQRWCDRCDEMALELARAHWFERQHQPLVDAITAAKQRYGDEPLLKQFRKRIDAEHDRHAREQAAAQAYLARMNVQ
jgi:hypothetical protein